MHIYATRPLIAATALLLPAFSYSAFGQNVFPSTATVEIRKATPSDEIGVRSGSGAIDAPNFYVLSFSDVQDGAERSQFIGCLSGKINPSDIRSVSSCRPAILVGHSSGGRDGEVARVCFQANALSGAKTSNHKATATGMLMMAKVLVQSVVESSDTRYECTEWADSAFDGSEEVRFREGASRHIPYREHRPVVPAEKAKAFSPVSFAQMHPVRLPKTDDSMLRVMCHKYEFHIPWQS